MSQLSDSDICVYRSPSVRKAQYKEIIERFPVGILVWHLEDENNEKSFKCVSSNHAAEYTTNPTTKDFLGKFFLELFPNTPVEWLQNLRSVALSKENKYNTINERTYQGAHYRSTYIYLPDNGAAILFERSSDSEEDIARRDGLFASISDILDNSIENIITDGKKKGGETAVLCNILCHMLNFITKTKMLGSSTNFKEKVQHATIFELVDRLFADLEDDGKFQASMLITYRYFASPVFLMSLLVFRFLTLNYNYTDDLTILRVKLRIIHFMLTWLENHFYDFLKSDRLMHIFNMFIELVISKSAYYQVLEWKNALAMVLDQQLRKYKRSTFLLENPTPHTPINLHIDILNYKSSDVAHQLTLLYMERFQYVMPFEFSHAAWTRSNSGVEAPNITDIIRLTNRVSQWVISSVVSSVEPLKSLKHFIDIAYDAFQYHDFETTFGITQALQNTPVARLNEVWKQLDSKTTKHWQKLLSITAPIKNFKKYRELYETVLQKSNTPVMPYFGILLKDIFFIDEGNEDFVNSTQVNFEKMQMLADYISRIIAMQKQSFSFTPSLVLKAYLLYDTLILSEEDQYSYSTKIHRISHTNSTTSLKNLLKGSPLKGRKSRSMNLNQEFDSTNIKVMRRKSMIKKGSSDDFSISYDSLLLRSSSSRVKTNTATNIPIITVSPSLTKSANL